MPINSRAKGARGEREWAEVLRTHGYEARRGQQFAGGTDSPDVVCSMPNVHFEVKRNEKLNVLEAMEQAQRDKGEGKSPVVAHKRNRGPWLVTLLAEDFFNLISFGLEGLAQQIHKPTEAA